MVRVRAGGSVMACIARSLPPIARLVAGAAVVLVTMLPGAGAWAQGMSMTTGPGVSMQMGAGGMGMGGMGMGMGGMRPGTTAGMVFIATGEPGAMFEARCIVSGPGWQENVALAGAVPFRRELAATGLNCSVAVRGGVTIEVQRPGGTMFWQVRDGSISINMS